MFKIDVRSVTISSFSLSKLAVVTFEGCFIFEVKAVVTALSRRRDRFKF